MKKQALITSIPIAIILLLSAGIPLLSVGAGMLPQTSKSLPAGWTPLHEAALQGDVATATALIKKKAKVDAFAYDDRTSDCWSEENSKVTPLAVALFHDKEELVRLLVNSGARLSLADSRGIPLHLAARNGNLSLVRFLVAHGADVNQCFTNGDTALHKAKTEEITSFLIAKGARAITINRAGQTPLFSAQTPGIAKRLLESGVPINQQDKEGQTPLLLAAKDQRFDVAKMLITRGANVNSGIDHSHWSALQWAVKNNDADLVHRLLKHGALVNPRSSETPLLLAAGNGLIDSGESDGTGVSADRGPATIARLLIAYGAAINVRSEKGETPLIRAALFGDDIMIPLLLKHGADINARDAQGDTALHCAAATWQSRVVRLLVKFGANQQIRNKNGETPLDVANKSQSEDHRNDVKPDVFDVLSKASSTIK